MKLTRYQPRLTQSRLTALLAGVVIGIAGCGGGSGGSGVEAPQGSSCTILEQNEFVQDVMQEFYLWNDRLPVADPAEFDSPQAYLDALRVPEDIYSFITPAAVEEAFYGEGQFAGLGFQSRQVEGQVRLLDVYEGSPAHEGGLRRGDSIVAVDGRPIGEILANEGFSASRGPPEAGVTVELTWREVAELAFATQAKPLKVTRLPAWLMRPVVSGVQKSSAEQGDAQTVNRTIDAVRTVSLASSRLFQILII